MRATTKAPIQLEDSARAINETGTISNNGRIGSNATATLIVPVYNEARNVQPFLQRVHACWDQNLPRLEILFIDDGSSDDTLERLRAAHHADPCVNYLALSRNFGKEAALTCGIDHVNSDAAVLIDADLQHPPELIPRLVERWQDGYDMVYATRSAKGDDQRESKHTSRLFYRLFNRLADTRIPPDAGDFRLLDRRVILALRQLPEKNRFMKGLYAWVGFRTTSLTYEQPPRHSGKSAFTSWKLWTLALDGLTGFSTWPLRVWSYVGAATALAAFLYASMIVIDALIGTRETPGYASLMTAILFLGGIQLLSVGILGEYIGRLFTEAKNRPVYLVAEAGQHDRP